MKKTMLASLMMLMVLASFAIAPITYAQTPAIVAAQPSAQTWVPTFNQAQTVYLDPALASHPTAPFQFSPEFKRKLLQTKHGTFYVIGAQQGNEPIPAGKKLGIAKVDELLPRWTNQPGFDKERYAIIFWVRRADDPTKGSVGVNVGAQLRSLGITTDLLNSPTGLVTPALKQYMPADPEGAILKIAQNIDNLASQTILKQQNQAAQIAQSQKEQAELRQAIAKLIDVVMGIISIGCIGGAGFILFRWRRNLRIDAQKLLEQWQVSIQNGADLYLELTESYVSKLDGIEWKKADERFREQYQTATDSLAHFMALWSKGKDILEQAQTQFDRGKSHWVIKMLNEEKIEITGDALPMEVTNLLTGRIQTKIYPAKTFLKEIDTAYKDARDRIVNLLEIYNNSIELPKESKAFNDKIDAIEQQITAPVKFKYNLSFGDDYPASGDISVPQQCTIAIANARTALQSALEAQKTSNFSEIADSLNTMRQNLETAKTERQVQIDTYHLCADKSRELIHAFTFLEQNIPEAHKTIAKIQSEFPAYELAYINSTLEKGQKLLNQRDLKAQNLRNLYLNQHFEEFRTQTNSFLNKIYSLESEFDHLNQLPLTLHRRIAKYRKDLEDYQRRAARLEHLKIDSDFEELNKAIVLGDFVDINHRLASVESKIQDAEQRYTATSSSSNVFWSSFGSPSSDSHWSSSNDSSWSSSSDYSSSSGGGDYGGSSGGSDY